MLPRVNQNEVEFIALQRILYQEYPFLTYLPRIYTDKHWLSIPYEVNILNGLSLLQFSHSSNSPILQTQNQPCLLGTDSAVVSDIE